MQSSRPVDFNVETTVAAPVAVVAPVNLVVAGSVPPMFWDMFNGLQIMVHMLCIDVYFPDYSKFFLESNAKAVGFDVPYINAETLLGYEENDSTRRRLDEQESPSKIYQEKEG